MSLRAAVGAAVAGVMMVSALAATPAAAHDELVSSAPEADAIVDGSPGQVNLTFSAPLRADAVQLAVVDSATRSVTDGAFTVDGPTVTQPISSELSAGLYRVSYRVVSSDGHTISGTRSFTVRGPAAAPSPQPQPATPNEEPVVADDSTTDGGGIGGVWWVVIAVGAVSLVGLIGVGLALWRRGRARGSA